MEHLPQDGQPDATRATGHVTAACSGRLLCVLGPLLLVRMAAEGDHVFLLITDPPMLGPARSARTTTAATGALLGFSLAILTAIVTSAANAPSVATYAQPLSSARSATAVLTPTVHGTLHSWGPHRRPPPATASALRAPRAPVQRHSAAADALPHGKGPNTLSTASFVVAASLLTWAVVRWANMRHTIAGLRNAARGPVCPVKQTGLGAGGLPKHRPDGMALMAVTSIDATDDDDSPASVPEEATAPASGDPSAQASAAAAPEPEEVQMYKTMWQAVKDHFYDETYNGVDWDGVREQALATPFAGRADARVRIQADLALLGDPWTRLLAPEEFTNISRRLDGRLEGGVGLEIGPAAEPGAAQLVVRSRTDGAPAATAGVREGDVILAVDGDPVAGQTQFVVGEKLVGPPGGAVAVTVQTPGQDPRTVTLAREEVYFNYLTCAVCKGVPNQTADGRPIRDVGYIRVPAFTQSTAGHFQAALDYMAGQAVEGVVVDLRNNVGGGLGAAFDMCSCVLPEGDLVQIRSRDAPATVRAQGTARCPDVPISVLVNEKSASSSEIFAVALQKAGRATVVGERTMGKGLIQDVRVLADGSAAVFTRQRYVAADGAEVDKVGITPDVGVPAVMLDAATGLPAEPAGFCAAWTQTGVLLFDGYPPLPSEPRAPSDPAATSAFC